MEIERYLDAIADPTIADFEANPTSVRHAFLAAVVVFHSIDYMAPGRSAGLRTAFRKQCPEFAVVDRIAHAFKHVETGHPENPRNQPLSADGVIPRPPAAWDIAVWDLSAWDDAIGGVTLDSNRAVDVLSAIKGAAQFVRQQFERRPDAAEKTEPDRRFRGPRLPVDAIKLTLTDAASRQVDAAIDAFERGGFDVAVTLAGAAEGMIKRDGNYALAVLRDNPRAKERFEQKKDWIALLNRERDWLKHGGDDEMEIECYDAAMMIVRAASKLEAWTPKMEAFHAWFRDNLDNV